MKKFIVYSVITVSLLSCMEKETRVFDKSPDERIIENIGKYESRLVSNEGGWILAADSKRGGFTYWLEFDGKNRVNMLSDAECFSTKYFPGSATDMLESSYSFNHMQNIVLSFDTYNYMHMICDPQGSMNGGSNSEGLVSDFQFYVRGLDENNDFDIVGRYNGVPAVLLPCTAEQGTALKNGGFKTIHQSYEDFVKNSMPEMDFPVLELDGKKYVVNYSSRSASVEFMNEQGKQETAASGAYLGLESLSGAPVSNLNLFKPIDLNGKLFKGMVYKDGKYYASVGGDLKEISDNGESIFPLDFGYRKRYNEIEIDPKDMEGSIREPFLTDVLQKAIDGFNAYHKGARTFEYFVFSFDDEAGFDEPVFIFRITYLTVSTGVKYSYYHYFTYRENEDGTITFTSRKAKNSSSRDNSEKGLKPLLDYFFEVEYGEKWEVLNTKERTFKLKYAPNRTPGLSGPLGGFYPVDDEECYCPGVLG